MKIVEKAGLQKLMNRSSPSKASNWLKDALTKFLEKQKAAEFQALTFTIQTELTKAQARMEEEQHLTMFNKIEEKQTEAPCKMLSFEDEQASINKLCNTGSPRQMKTYYYHSHGLWSIFKKPMFHQNSYDASSNYQHRKCDDFKSKKKST